MYNGAAITFQQLSLPTAQQIADSLHIALEDRIIVTFQEEQTELSKTTREMMINGAVAKPDTTVQNGSSIHFNLKDVSKWIYQDVFRFSNWQLPVDFKGHFTILRNGEPSSFDAEIFGGDRLEIQLVEQKTGLS